MQGTISLATARRVIWQVEGENVTESFHKTDEFCISCGKQGLWTSGGGDHRICTDCETVIRLGDQPVEPATDFWAEILTQLRS
jgi:Fe2+ or Zn2+ uptake regulation protein